MKSIAVINVLASTKSTGKIAYGLYQHLKNKGHDVVLYYGREEESNLNDSNVIRIESNFGNHVHALASRVFGNQGEFSKGATRRMIKDMEKRGVEVVYLLNIHGYYMNYPMFFDYCYEKGIKIIYLMVDEYPYHAKCAVTSDCRKFETECNSCPLKKEYPKSLFIDASRHIFYEKKKAYRGNDITFVGIDYAVEEAKKSAIIKNSEVRFAVLDEAIDVKNRYYPRNAEDLKAELGLQNKKIILNVAPYTNERKGCRFYLEAAKRLQNNDDIVFIHLGFDGDKSICPPNYIPVSYVSDIEKMAEYYSMADLFVCTSYAETIANACLEALACGTPLLAFDCCGMSTCAEEDNLKLVQVGDIDALTREIESAPRKTAERSASCRDYAVKRYDNTYYFEKLESFMKD